MAVYTQPDRPAGRSRRLTASPVKTLAQELGIPVRQPERFVAEHQAPQMRRDAVDVMVVVAYGLLLPKDVLSIPTNGCWNIHASLLPRWRGAAPIQRAIEAGDTHTGVSLMQMSVGLDCGPVLMHLDTPIAADETAGQLHDRLAGMGAEIIKDALTLLCAGMRPIATPQQERGVCYAKKLTKNEATLNWENSADQIVRTIRAFSPWPIAETSIANERLRIHHAKVLDATSTGLTPGSVVARSHEGIDIACAIGIVRLLRVQRAGGKIISAADYCNALAK